MSVKRGVSLYSYQENFFLGKMNLEDCIAAVAKTGATGIELIPEQNCAKEYRKPSPGFISQWKEWMAKYNTESVAIDIFNDYKIYHNRNLTEKEEVDQFEGNMEFASKLGFKIARAMITTPIWIIERMIPIAEYYDVKFGVELHAPYSLKDPAVQTLFELIDRTGTKHIGLIPDMSIFNKEVPRVQMDKYIRAGANPEIIGYICRAYKQRLPILEVNAKILEMGAENIEVKALQRAYFSQSDKPEWLVDCMDKIIHIHGKVYEMDENCVETSIDYESVLPVLIKGGYNGYISTEYEGQRFFHDQQMGDAEVDEVEQVRRHQMLLKKLID